MNIGKNKKEISTRSLSADVKRWNHHKYKGGGARVRCFYFGDEWWGGTGIMNLLVQYRVMGLENDIRGHPRICVWGEDVNDEQVKIQFD